ncbi:MAG: response regulator [Sandaracinaceae bacterium]|nr:response regulator [Sandaracinaceae bacterium]
MGQLVLLADGDPFNLRLLEELCTEAGFELVTASDGSGVLDVIARQRPALIVLDAELRTDDGADVLEVLQSDPALAHIPVLLATEREDDEARRRGIERGASDFVTRPYRVFEVEQRMRNLLRLAAAEERAERARSPLSSPPTEGTDPLTHAGGEAQLRMTLEYEVTRAVRYGSPLTCVVLRIANLGAIVQTSGDDTGVGLVLQLASNLRRAIRSIDHLFRSDTDEFTLLLPETSATGAEVVVARLRAEASDGALAGVGIEPAPALMLGLASVGEGSPIVEGEALRRAARDALRALPSA